MHTALVAKSRVEIDCSSTCHGDRVAGGIGRSTQMRGYRVARKQGLLIDQLCKDAANGPEVDSCGIVLGSQQNLWGSIPQRHHLHLYCQLLNSIE